MRIHDVNSDQTTTEVVLFLTRSEARDLRGIVKSIEGGASGIHEHVDSADFKRQITVCIYDEGDLDGLDARSREIIEKNL